MQGIEVVNSDEYYPEVHRWCLEKNLTMLGNSDMHSPSGEAYESGGKDGETWFIVTDKDRIQAVMAL